MKINDVEVINEIGCTYVVLGKIDILQNGEN